MEAVDIVFSFVDFTQVEICDCDVLEARKLAQVVVEVPSDLQLALEGLQCLLAVIHVHEAMTDLLKSIHGGLNILTHFCCVPQFLEVFICLLIVLPYHESVPE